jgi:hypothetical protein
MTNVYVKISSSSLLILRRKFGWVAEGNGSGSCGHRGIRIIQDRSSTVFIQYLDIFYDAAVAQITTGSHLCRRKGIWEDADNDVPPGVCYGQGGE